VASPAELILHYHSLNTSCFGLREDTGFGTTRLLLVQLQGLQCWSPMRLFFRCQDLDL